MNRITFKKARIKNFLSYGNTWQEFYFPIGMNMVQGLNIDTLKSNGAGKSSVTEIIPFALFGKTIKNLPQVKVINWHNRKGCLVELYFNVNDDEYVFTRGLKPNKFSVNRNGHDIVRPSDIKSFQYQMEQDVIGMDFKTFKNLIYFSPNNTISILGAKKEVKRQFLESLFDLSEYSDMLKITNAKIGSLSSKVNDNDTTVEHNTQKVEMIKKDCDEQVKPDMTEVHLKINQLGLLLEGLHELKMDDSACQETYDVMEEHLEGLKTDHIFFTSNKSTYIAQVKAIQDAIAAIDVDKPRRQTDDINLQIETLRERMGSVDVDDIADNIVTIKEDVQELVDEKDRNRESIQTIQKTQEVLGYVISSEKDTIHTIKARGNNISGKDQCDFCGAECDQEQIKAHHETQIQEHLDRIDKETIAISNSKKSEKVIVVRNTEIDEEAKTLKELYTECKYTLTQHDDDVNTVKSLKEKLQLIPDVKGLELDILEKNLKLTELQQSLLDVQWKFDMNKEDIDSKTKRLADLKVQIDEQDKHIKRIEVTTNELATQKERVDELQKMSDDIDAKIKSKQVDIVTILAESVDLEKNSIKYNKMLDHLNYLRVSLKDDNVKQFAISSLLPFLNSRANYYLQESGFPYVVYIDGWLDVIIRGMGTEDVGYESLSGGEQKAMDMAIQLACNDIAELHAKTILGIAVYDEILDTSLDADGVQKLMDIVRVKQRDTNNCVLIISHRDEIKELDFDNYVMVEKENGFSVIQTQSTMV
jgi:DNA repair exonuclease SbcCD ATPase subunit